MRGVHVWSDGLIWLFSLASWRKTGPKSSRRTTTSAAGGWVPWRSSFSIEASESTSLDEIVARVAEAAGIARSGEELAGKIRTQLRALYGADLLGVRCPTACCPGAAAGL